jgi:ABC-type multidrug transport system fused ATPase/permease subunit
MQKNGVLWHYLKNYKVAIAIALFCAFVLGILSTVLACLLGPTIKIMLQSANKEFFSLSELFSKTLLQYIIVFFPQKTISSATIYAVLPKIVLCLVILKAIFYITQTIIWDIIGEKVSKSIRTKTISSYIHSDNYLLNKNQDPREQMSAILTNDSKVLKEYISHFYGGIPRELLQILFLSILLFFLSAKMFLMFLALLTPIIIILQVLGKKIKSRYTHALNHFAQLSDWIQQRFLGIETIKQFRTENNEIKKMQKLNFELYKKFLQAERTKARTSPIIETITFTSFLLVLTLAIKEISSTSINESITFSFFVSVGMLAQSISILGRYFNSNKEGHAALMRITTINQDLQKIKRHVNIDYLSTNSDCAITCSDLEVVYKNTNKPVLNNFSYNFKKGKLYSIMGPSGCGKSSLIKALSTIITPWSGKILYQRSDHPHFVGYIPQSFYLYRGSIAENVSYPEKNPNLDRIKKALKSVCLDQLISQLENGCHTKIGEKDSFEISGGEAQRIKLARIFYHKFPLILIDEGTSALDAKTEESIFVNLKDLITKDNLTCIQVSHRSSVKKFSDHIILLNGK